MAFTTSAVTDMPTSTLDSSYPSPNVPVLEESPDAEWNGAIKGTLAVGENIPSPDARQHDGSPKKAQRGPMVAQAGDTLSKPHAHTNDKMVANEIVGSHKQKSAIEDKQGVEKQNNAAPLALPGKQTTLKHVDANEESVDTEQGKEGRSDIVLSPVMG